MAADIPTLKALEQKILWLACWTIHNANNLRPKEEGGVKVGGHQASSASMVSIMAALYFHTLRPQDRVAVKPHASPVFHAIQYLMGNQTREKLEAFRGFGGVQSYPSRTKDVDDVDFSTGSVGLGVAITAFASLVQDYLSAKPWAASQPPGRMVALLGDAELDEGNIYECLQEVWKHDLRNIWWIVDYNRQSLDGVISDGLDQRLEDIFKAFSWNVVRLKYGALQQAAFARPGGERLRAWIDQCPNLLYSALSFQGGAAWREQLMSDIGDQGDVSALIDSYSDAELDVLMNNLGGQCIQSLCEAFDAITDDKPTMFLAYTIKGWGTPLAGHKDNHAGLMTKAQMAEWQTMMGVPEGSEWEPYAGMPDPQSVHSFLERAPFFAQGRRRHQAARIETTGPVQLTDRELSTQAGFGKILDALAKSDAALADRIMTTAPDVTVSTNLGPWVNRRGLYARNEFADLFRDQRIPSAQKWRFAPDGQHVELGIAEMNLFLLLGAAGLSHSLFGERIIPVGTVYDPFVERGLDALTYACYQDARFIIAGTPSGVTLAPEGGAHQSIGTQLVGMSRDGLATFEPAYLDELSIIMDWAFEYLQREGPSDLDARTCLPDAKGGAVYLRLSTKPLEQVARRDDPTFAQDVIDGGYWLRPPGPNADLIIAYMGCIAPEAIEAAARLYEDRRDIGVLAVTSPDRLYQGWKNALTQRRRGERNALSHAERLLSAVPRHATLLTVTDGYPASLSWLSGVTGLRCIPLGVDHFGQTGTIADLYRHFDIDADAIVEAAHAHIAGRPVRYR